MSDRVQLAVVSVIERRTLPAARRSGPTLFLVVILLLAFIPYLGLALDSFGKGWALTPFPVKYTLQYFERVAFETPKFIINSLLYSGISVVICIAVGVRSPGSCPDQASGADLLDSLTR